MIVDIHTHPTLRAFNAAKKDSPRNIWEKTHNPEVDTKIGRWARMKSKDILKSSQANLQQYAASKTRVVFDSLYPLEKGFLKLRKVPGMVLGKDGGDQLFQAVTGFDTHQMKAMRNSDDYFQELSAQYAFLVNGQGQSPCGSFSYELASNWSDVERILRQDDHTIAVVVNLEGAHSYASCLHDSKISAKQAEREILSNIGISKSWQFAPFSVNLAHHFYNGLTGHSRSLKAGIYHVVNQKEGIGEGLTPLGKKVVFELLSRENGRRTLIDIKHMSVKARNEYYQMLEANNRLNPHDKIPIICSHTGMNEFETLRESRKKKDKARKSKGTYFHNWAINLCNEEIRLIHDSGGLIGIMVDKGLLGSHETVERIRGLENDAEKRDAFLELIASNIFHAVQAIGKPSAWDVLALGTDYDGMIAHIDLYPEAATLGQLREDLISFLERKRFGESLWFGYEPAQIVDKIMSGNALTFMRDHF